jgi:hypothetical protein
LLVIDAISGAETQVNPWNFPWETPDEEIPAWMKMSGSKNILRPFPAFRGHFRLHRR